MKESFIIIKSKPNTLIPLSTEKKVFKWDANVFSHSQEALDYIELLIMENRSFTVKTSATFDYDNLRIDIIWGKHETF